MKDRQNYEYVITIKSVLEDIKSMNSLSNGLLDLAQANLDISKLKLKKVRIDELLWSIHNELTKRNHQITINLNIINFPEEEASLVVLGSEQLLRTAVTNLIENACKFSSDKTCQLDFSTTKGLIILTCTDYGIGISEDEQKKILEPFYRGTNAKSFAGYGIGLSLANKIISLHKGELTIDSKLNKYTKISVTLPC
jgi:signal transduction histidine kinase